MLKKICKSLKNKCDCFNENLRIPTITTGPRGPQGPTGATGPTGPMGGTVVARSTTTVSSDENAAVMSSLQDNTTYLDFYIPKGVTGESDTIVAGNVESVSPDEKATVSDRYSLGLHYLDFKIPRGVTGEKGDKGDKGEKGDPGLETETDVKGAYIISYNDDPNNFPVEGKEIPSNGRLPLMRLELDYGDIIELDSTDNTIQFNKTGVYGVTFTTNAYVKKTGVQFDPVTDFVSVAFREAGNQNIIAAATSWSSTECAVNMTGQALFVVSDLATAYELVNTQQKSIYINGCNVQKTVSHSYFAVPMVTIVITKLF